MSFPPDVHKITAGGKNYEIEVSIKEVAGYRVEEDGEREKIASAAPDLEAIRSGPQGFLDEAIRCTDIVQVAIFEDAGVDTNTDSNNPFLRDPKFMQRAKASITEKPRVDEKEGAGYFLQGERSEVHVMSREEYRIIFCHPKDLLVLMRDDWTFVNMITGINQAETQEEVDHILSFIDQLIEKDREANE